PAAFFVALATVAVWALVGPRYQYSDTWQLVINTGTTIVTFLMVFLIQNAQNRDARAIHLKLDELIRGVRGARNAMIELQDLTDDQLDELQEEFQRLRESGRLRRPGAGAAPGPEAAAAPQPSATGGNPPASGAGEPPNLR